MTHQDIKLSKLKKLLGNKIETNKDLFSLLTLHTRTRAEYYFEARSKEDWQKAIYAAHKLNIPVFVLGGGSNIAVFSQTIKALVIKNLYIKKEKIRENEKTVDLLISSGYPTTKLVNETVEEGLEGLEYYKGLPGSIGGAIYMNSKWTKPLRYIGDLVIRTLVLDKQGNFKTVKKSKMGEILIEAVLRLKKTPVEILKKRAQEAVDYRLKTQPKGLSSCGCFFRNISQEEQKKAGLPTNSVGYLIDQLGLKNLVVGGFTISDIHGNFIVNKEGKKSNTADLKKLLKIIKDKVRNKYGIELEEEVVLI